MDRYDPYTDKFLRDTQYGILGTNLAEVGMDCISRQAVMLRVREFIENPSYTEELLVGELNGLPSAQPEIIYCKDCAKHNKGLGSYEVHPDGSSTWIWKDSACPLVSWRGKAQGHEYDYQYCVYAERKVTE